MYLSKKLKKIILLSLSIYCTHKAYAAGLSPIETKIIAHIEQTKEKQLQLLERLVNINSGTDNIPGVKATGLILEKAFQSIGFKTRWIAEPASMRRAPTLIAERIGNKGKRLLLIGHLDTVFPKNSPFQRFERHGDKATGPGIIDDKGGDVVILYALQALESVHALDDATIRVVLTGDEEDSGKPTSISRKPLKDAAIQSDIALDFECDITQDTATIARRGVSMWTIKAKGIEAHSAEIFKPEVGDGAIYELSRILDSMRAEFSAEKDLSLNPGLVLGGTEFSYNKNLAKGKAFGKENVVAKMALASGDIRFISQDQLNTALEKIRTIVAKHAPGTKSELSIQDGIPAMSPTAANLALLQEYGRVSESLGFGPVKPLPPNIRGAGDISHIAQLVSANLAGLGPLGEGAHSIKESLYIPSLTMQTKRAAIFMYQLINKS